MLAIGSDTTNLNSSPLSGYKHNLTHISSQITIGFSCCIFPSRQSSEYLNIYLCHVTLCVIGWVPVAGRAPPATAPYAFNKKALPLNKLMTLRVLPMGLSIVEEDRESTNTIRPRPTFKKRFLRTETAQLHGLGQ